MSILRNIYWGIMATLALLILAFISDGIGDLTKALERPPVVVTVVCPAGTAMVLASQENVWTCVDAKEAG